MTIVVFHNTLHLAFSSANKHGILRKDAILFFWKDDYKQGCYNGLILPSLLSSILVSGENNIFSTCGFEGFVNIMTVLSK